MSSASAGHDSAQDEVEEVLDDHAPVFVDSPPLRLLRVLRSRARGAFRRGGALGPETGIRSFHIGGHFARPPSAFLRIARGGGASFRFSSRYSIARSLFFFKREKNDLRRQGDAHPPAQHPESGLALGLLPADEDTLGRIQPFLSEYMNLTEEERRFAETFRKGEYRPELLFADAEILEMTLLSKITHAKKLFPLFAGV